MEHKTNLPENNGRPNPPPQFIRKRELAAVISVSERSIDNLISRRMIPQIRLSSRLTRFNLPDVLAALARFEVKEIGARP